MNSFFGQSAGLKNVGGVQNTFIGSDAGVNNTSGSGNVAVGVFAGQSNTIEGSNTFVGYVANGTAGINNATAIGAGAQVSQSNSLVLGGMGVNVGIGTGAPVARLDVRGDSVVSGNFGIGTTSPGVKLQVHAELPSQTAPVEAIRIDGPNSPADANSAQDLKWAFASAGSAGVRSYRGNSWDTYLQFLTNAAAQGADSPQIRMHIDQTGNVGIGTVSPATKLHVNGVIRLDVLGLPLGNSPLCLNVINQIAFCNVSSLRYKTNVQPFAGGLNVIRQLRPIAFDWKEGGVHDVGLAAEEVNQVAPLFAFRNNKGEIEGVKYNQLSVVFINAFKEQQLQIKNQQDELKRQRDQIKQQNEQAREQRAAFLAQQEELDQLKKLVCRGHRRASVCRQANSKAVN